jgi:hypothetical protein
MSHATRESSTISPTLAWNGSSSQKAKYRTQCAVGHEDLITLLNSYAAVVK